jgi:hypothetical protein
MSQWTTSGVDRSIREWKGSKAAAHPLVGLDASTMGPAGADVGGQSAVGSAAASGGGGGGCNQPFVVPLPFKTRNQHSLNRSERRREVLSTYKVDDDSPILTKLLKESGEVLSETQELTLKLQRMSLELEEQTGKRGRGQTELIFQVERMDEEIKTCWEKGEKVKALRIAIQACKMLGYTTVPESYPSLFILAAQVLDTFGDFVAQRLQATAVGRSAVVAALLRRGQDASIDLIPAEAVEIANNWFLKISSIRELLPRIYIELSLVKCYRYVAKKMRVNMKETVGRLGRQIRGVGNAVVAVHARWYLFLRAAEVLKGEGWAIVLVQCALDALVTMGGFCQHHLMMPAILWMFDVLATHGGKKKQPKIVAALIEEATNERKTPEVQVAVCNAIAKAFSPEHLFPHLSMFLEKASLVADTLRYYLPYMTTLFHLLAEIPDLNSVLQRKDKVNLLKQFWIKVMEAQNPSNRISPIVVLDSIGAVMRYAAIHLGEKQLNVLFQELRTFYSSLTLKDAEVDDACFEAINGIVMKIDISTLLELTHFLPALQCLPGELQRRIATFILDSIPKRTSNRAQVLELCRIIHDGVDDHFRTGGKVSIAAELAGASVSNAIRNCVADDPETYLLFLSECRHSLPRLDAVKSTLIHEALQTVIRCSVVEEGHLQNVKRSNAKRSAAKACLAFAHVTAPAIKDIFSRLRHLILAASVGFQHGYLSQGESLLQLAVQTLKQIVPIEWFDGATRDNDAATIAIAQQVCAVGVLTPPHHKYGYLYLVDSILQWVAAHPWPERSTGAPQVLLALLQATARSCAQDSPKWSGASLLNAGEEYEAIRAEKCTTILVALHDAIEDATNKSVKVPNLAPVCLDVIDTIVFLADLEQSSAAADVVALCHRVTVEAGLGTIEYVRRMQQVTRTAQEHIGEELWAQIISSERISSTKKTRKQRSTSPVEDESKAQEESVPAAQTAAASHHVDPNASAGAEIDDGSI